MWCLLLVEKEVETNLADALRIKGYQIHASFAVDDLLDALWYHGSDVACIIIEKASAHDLNEFYETMTDWPTIMAVIYESKNLYPVMPNIVQSSKKCSIDRILQQLGI